MSRPTAQIYKEMLVDALIKQHEGLADLHAAAPTSELVELLAESVTSNLNYDVEVVLDSEYEGTYEANVVNISLNRSAEKMVSSAGIEIMDLRSSLQNQMDQVVTDFLNVAQTDLDLVKDPQWSWNDEPEESSLDTVTMWLQNASALSPTAVKKYLQLVFNELQPSHTYSKLLLEFTTEYGAEMTSVLTELYGYKEYKRWVIPVVSAIKEEDNPRVIKQMNAAFKGLWLKNAISYMLKGCETSKNTCEEIESLGFNVNDASFAVTLFNSVPIEDFGVVLNRASEYQMWKETLFSDIETPAQNSFAFAGSNVYNALKKVSQAHADVYLQHHLMHKLSTEEFEARPVRKI